jgi:integrase
MRQVKKSLMVSVTGKNLSANTLHRRFDHAMAVMNYAVEIGALSENALERPTKAELKKVKKSINMNFPELATMLNVVAAVQSRRNESRLYRAVSAIGVLAGLRPSETMALEVEHVELPVAGWGSIRVEKARIGLVGWSDDPEEIGDPKVERSVRTVPIPPALISELRAWLAFSEIHAGPLFRTRGEKVPLQSNWNRALGRATNTVGTRRLAPYDLRRFHGTWLAQSGVPYNEAARRMGHSLETFMRYYVGTTDGVAQVGNDALDRAFEK